MTNILGPYYSPWHWRGEDEEYMRRLDPAWARIHQPTGRAIFTVQQCAPNANVMLRSWDIDDNNSKRKQEVYADPIGAARKHMDMWAGKLKELEADLRTNGWAYDKTKWFLGLVNEPDPEYVQQVVDYSLEAMRIARERGRHLGVVVSSVGTFSKPSENDRGWALCKPLEKPINEGGHILMVHEYWQPEGPSYGEDEGNLAWRHHIIPLDVPILIAESGANGYIYGRYSKNDDAGWQKFMKPEQFAAQVKEYIAGCDERVKGVLLYMLDFHSDQWFSFDTMPAMHQLLAIADARPQVPSPFASKPIGVSRFLRGDIVRTTTTVNVRRTPGTQGKATDDVVRQLAPNSAVELLEGPQHADGLTWWRTEAGWLAEVAPNGITLLTNKADVSVPDDSNWERCIAFVARWEGGWVENLNDPGGPTNRGITIGTFTKWRQSQGRQIPTKEDLRNIGTVEVDEIYREWYWIASGANKLPWPNCLAVFDLAVNGGVDRAKQFIAEVGTDFIALMARRIDWYTRIANFEYFGKAWIRRCADLMKTGA